MKVDSIKEELVGLTVGLVLSVFLILVDGMGWAVPVYDWGNYLLEPVEYWMSRVTVGTDNFVSMIWEIGSLRSRNADLEIDNAILKAELGLLNETSEENSVLRHQLGIEMTREWNLSLVRILGIDPEKFAGYVLIDGGRDEGIEVGDMVILGNILIGEVHDVFKSTSRVRLVSSQNSNIVAITQETRAKGLVHGSLEGIMIEDVLENEELNKGDIAITWQDDIPKGVIVGEIVEIYDNPTASTKSARLESGLNIEELDYVFVVTDY